MGVPTLSPALRRLEIEPTTGPVRLVLDTDTYNEIDDQFAVVYSLLSGDRIATEAIYAAPFHNQRSTGPGDGMEKSHEEILRLLDRLGRSADRFVYRGSKAWLPDTETPVESDAAADLVAKALAGPAPLYVVAIGAITNVASALLMQPEIAEHIVIVWLGGQPRYWPSAEEFNLRQDIYASRLVFDCGVPLIHIPCATVASHLLTTVAEIERYVEGRGPIGDYLAQIFKEYNSDHFAWSKVIWDLACIGWCINSEWVPTQEAPSPILTDDLTWRIDPSRHPIREATYVHRDPIFRDLFQKLEMAAR
ncbi:MAG: nucleoside hydrolase [Armatimonadetes bacterium]|nr:nucleoside hydrolase [Armatimonadota bacterium]